MQRTAHLATYRSVELITDEVEANVSINPFLANVSGCDARALTTMLGQVHKSLGALHSPTRVGRISVVAKLQHLSGARCRRTTSHCIEFIEWYWRYYWLGFLPMPCTDTRIRAGCDIIYAI